LHSGYSITSRRRELIGVNKAVSGVVQILYFWLYCSLNYWYRVIFSVKAERGIGFLSL